MIFVNRVFFSSYMDFYVYDLLNGMHWGHAPELVRMLPQIIPDDRQPQAQILRWHWLPRIPTTPAVSTEP